MQITASTPITARIAATRGSSMLGQAEFLKLLTTQLTNQSPLDPMENETFVAQMAQFSTVSGIAEMNASLKALAGKAGDPLASAAALIGREALVPADTAALQRGASVGGAISLDQPADALDVLVRDASGRVIDMLHLGPNPAGDVNFTWTATADGPVRFEPVAIRSGAPLAAGVSLAGRVAGVRSRDGATLLDVAGIGEVPSHTVRALRL
jgi:flagellar basal-body rod modification protein FlgD